MRKITEAVVHCSATRESQDYTYEDLRRGHLSRGFNDVGYHYYIRRDGEVISCRPIEKKGAHVKGYNKNTIGICYEGGLDDNGKPKDTRTESQKRELIFLLKGLKIIFNLETIKGHRDYSKDLNGNGKIDKYERMKACPCFDAIPEYKHITN